MLSKSKARAGMLIVGPVMMSFAFLISARTHIPDVAKGILYGIAIGIMLLFLVTKKLRATK